MASGKTEDLSLPQLCSLRSVGKRWKFNSSKEYVFFRIGLGAESGTAHGNALAPYFQMAAGYSPKAPQPQPLVVFPATPGCFGAR